ncbi:MAG TPA: histidine kinase [Terriglobales bacterium]|nr:histidine kinase [Terriglobales bacterium]
MKTKRWPLIWILSFAVWIFLSLVATISVVQLYRGDSDFNFSEIAGMQFSQLMPFALLTPLVFWLADRFPMGKQNWVRRSVLYLAAGFVFAAGHIAMRGVTPYGVFDPKTRTWHSAFWDYKAHKVDVRWRSLERMFLVNAFDDINGTYLPIILVAYVVSYYSRLKDRDLAAAHLEAQLSKANLRALKSQLQPHFLFNTMHSISGLMFTDPHAADAMMSRLSELLRMSFEDGAEQITTLNRELEFVNGYLEIEKMRLGDRLTVDLDISPETLDAQVPHLLLQPLVENAVQHGVAKLSSKGNIRICSGQDGRNLWLKISDNGPGFNCPADSAPKSGLGLRASQERLQTLYGENQSFTFGALATGGTEITIRIPFRPTVDGE